MIVLELLMISIILGYVYEISGFVDSMKQKWFRLWYGNRTYIDFSFKPFTCCTCMTLYVCMMYVYFFYPITLFNMFFLPVVFSWLSEKIILVMFLVDDFIGWVMNKLNDRLQ